MQTPDITVISKAQCDINVRLFQKQAGAARRCAYDYSLLHRRTAQEPCVLQTPSLGKLELRQLQSYGRMERATKRAVNGGTEETFYPNHCWVSFRYGNGSLNAGISVSQPFNNHTVQKSTTNDGPYSASRIQWSTGRSISIDLTYTFDYGKKIDPGFDIYEESLNNSSHL